MTTERPILFSGPMVLAILDGRKTQTRRVVKRNASGRVERGGRQWHIDDEHAWKACPYGQPGDRLWVREAWCCKMENGEFVYEGERQACHYRADGEEVVRMDGDGGTVFRKDGTEASPWVPSIHMPRWASRITLEVVSVRVERVRDILEEDARAEGAVFHDGGGVGHSGWRHDPSAGYVFGTAIHSFAGLWNAINAKRGFGWDVNPWVWAVEFRSIEP